MDEEKLFNMVVDILDIPELIRGPKLTGHYKDYRTENYEWVTKITFDRFVSYENFCRQELRKIPGYPREINSLIKNDIVDEYSYDIEKIYQNTKRDMLLFKKIRNGG